MELDKIPTNPGVYIMKNSKNKIIYIGKAKNLKKRVSSYFTGSHNQKTMELVKNISDIEFFICNSEIEALILENNLIKQHKPKYNILLKDQKTYPYIRITKEELPRISTTRNTKTDDYYFGPFPNVNMKQVLNSLMKIFKIRDCKIDVYANHQRPCLKYHMNLCNAPCVYKDENTFNEYKANVKNLINFLSSKDTSILKELEVKMKECSDNFEFEKAIVERERIKAFKKLLESQITEINRNYDEDVILIEKDLSNIFICILSIREGKLVNKYFDVIKSYVEDDNLETFILQYYDKKALPKRIILDEVFEDKKEALEQILGKKKISISKRKGRIKDLLELVKLNLKMEKDAYYNKKENLNKALLRMQQVLNLKKKPVRIECFDISNIQGTNPVASMSVAINGELSKKDYRHFKITVKDTPDDFMMMREALTRRYSKLEIDELPDLILIDGGKGQIGVAVDVLTKLNKKQYLDIISIAKREEEIFKDIEKIPYIFARNDEVLRILQRLRDEAHRFGITHHRKLRDKRIMTSVLDEIHGIGAVRKKKLLKKFKTVKGILEASDEELLEILPAKIVEELKLHK